MVSRPCPAGEPSPPRNNLEQEEAHAAEPPHAVRPSPDGYPDLTAVWRRAVLGESGAYADFLRRVTPLLRRMAARAVPEADAEDVAQEILISLHKAAHTHDGLRPVMPWVAAVARYRTADYLRGHYARSRDLMQDGGDPDDICSDSSWSGVTGSPPEDESVDAEEALSHASERERTILLMMHSEGFTAKETGARLGMSESAVKTAAHRAMKKIRERFGR